MISVIEAQKQIEQRVLPLESEFMSLSEAQGRLLREVIVSPEDLPPFDRSAMDGYAIREDDSADQFSIVGEIRAGQMIDRILRPGETIRIFTGARLPAKGVKVVMQEHVEAADGRMRMVKSGTASNVRLKGDDVRAGETLLEPGATLDAPALALLASIGKTFIRVSRRPRILHLTTGDEIVPLDQNPGPGQIRNSNASLIAALCHEAGSERVTHFHSGDDLHAMVDLLKKARVSAYDVILISGGSGSGAYDFSGELFGHLQATIHFREINVRPGKPLIFGTTGSQVIFGLPGNILSHFVCFHLFVRRALDYLLARPVRTNQTGILAEPMPDTHNARETWWPARVNLRDGRLECRALPWKSSGDITHLPASNALIKVPASTTSLAAGTMVEGLLTRNLN